MLVTLEIRLRLQCPACSGHTLLDLVAARAGAFVCSVCRHRGAIDLEDVRRRIVALGGPGPTAGPTAEPSADARDTGIG